MEVDGKSIIIDSGPDLRQQVLRYNITSLDALLFTHAHKDHTAGLDETRSFNQIQQSAIPIYCTATVLKRLKQEYAYIFADDDYPGIPKLVPHLFSSQPFEVLGTLFTPIKVMHHKMVVHGFRVGNFTYITDAKHIAQKEKDKIRGSKVLVLNALQHEQNIAHLTLSEALELVDELQPERAYFTHISHKLGLHYEISKELPTHVHLAYDGLSLDI